MQPLAVVAGVLRDAQGRVLVAQRPHHKHQGGLWEFPGGKREAGETPLQALRRELHEELGIDIGDATPLLRVPWRYPGQRVDLEVLQVEGFTGTPQGREGQALAWVAVDELHRWPLPAADRPVVSALRLPREYAITRDPDLDAEALLAAALAQLQAGSRLLQLRAKTLGLDATARVLAGLLPVARDCSANILVNTHLALARAVDGVGIHLTAAQLDQLDRRPLPRDRWVCASCHDPREIERAVALDCDFIVLAPVLPTASHPGARTLGWPDFARLSALSPLPVFALGGLAPSDLDTAIAHGAFGIAGIAGFEAPSLRP